MSFWNQSYFGVGSGVGTGGHGEVAGVETGSGDGAEAVVCCGATGVRLGDGTTKEVLLAEESEEE